MLRVSIGSTLGERIISLTKQAIAKTSATAAIGEQYIQNQPGTGWSAIASVLVSEIPDTDRSALSQALDRSGRSSWPFGRIE